MKIPALPQVLFDEFPSDDNTKICIFTQPKYPVPDLRKFVGKTSLFCTEMNAFFMLTFAKRLPLELFQLLPSKETQWIQFDYTNIAGLNTSFNIACIPTGSVIGSIMLLIHISDKPNELILYTGSFKECHTVLLSDMLLKYRRKIKEVYFDSTMAGSQHNDVTQINRTCDDIKKIIEKYPHHKIHLQMDTFDSLDLLVNLARRHRINVKLSDLQQIFIYLTQYRHLFELDAKTLLARGKDLNVNFHFKDRPKIFVKSFEKFDAFTYKKHFEEDKIINIRLIPCTSPSPRFDNPITSGVFCVDFTSHAGAWTLKGLFDAVKPNRVHPISMNNEPNESWSTIPENILNVDCEIISIPEVAHDFLEVNLEDINQQNRSDRQNRSFLDASTLVSGTASNKTLSDPDENASNSDNNEPVAEPRNDSTEPFDEDVAIVANLTDNAIEIHDSDSDGDSAPKTSNKRRSDSTVGNNDSKIFKSENSSTAVNIHSSENSMQMKEIEYDNYSFSSDSDCELVFPD